MLFGFFVKRLKLSGIHQAKARLKEWAIQRVWSCKVQLLWDSESGSTLFTNWDRIFSRQIGFA